MLTVVVTATANKGRKLNERVRSDAVLCHNNTAPVMVTSGISAGPVTHSRSPFNVLASCCAPVSYTHLTLPTIYSV